MSPDSSPSVARQPFAPGEHLTRFPAGSPHALRLDCQHEKPGWQARLPGGLIEAQFAGTAVFFEERYYEVVAARSVGAAVSYYLDPWDDSIVLRRIVELSPEASAREAEARSRDVRHRSAASALVVLTPLIGLLPASYQEAVERRYGLPASRSTGWSAAAILAVASAIFVLALGQNFATRTGAGDGDGWGPWLLPASYFMVESLLRLGAAMTAGEANGTLPVVLLLQIAALLRGRPRANPRLVPGHAEALRSSDEVTLVDGAPARLEIVSRLAKPHWTRATGIRYQERWFRLAESSLAERGGSTVHVFVLEEDPEALSMRGAAEYDPREVLTLEWETRRARQATWVETFAPLWGLLDVASQDRLAAAYDFDPRRASQLSILAAALGGAALAGLAATYLASGAGGFFDFVALLGGGLVTLDALRRALVMLGGGRTGSVLAPVVRPLCAGALSASSPPASR